MRHPFYSCIRGNTSNSILSQIKSLRLKAYSLLENFAPLLNPTYKQTQKTTVFIQNIDQNKI